MRFHSYRGRTKDNVQIMSNVVRQRGEELCQDATVQKEARHGVVEQYTNYGKVSIDRTEDKIVSTPENDNI